MTGTSRKQDQSRSIAHEEFTKMFENLKILGDSGVTIGDGKNLRVKDSFFAEYVAWQIKRASYFMGEGPNFFGPFEWMKLAESLLSENFLLTEEQEKSLTLELYKPCPLTMGKSVHETHNLVFIPRSINYGMKESKVNLRLMTGNDILTVNMPHHYSESDLYEETPRGKWLLIHRRVVPCSINLDLEDQMKLLPDDYIIPSAIEVACGLLLPHYRCRGNSTINIYNQHGRVRQSPNGKSLVFGDVEDGFSVFAENSRKACRKNGIFAMKIMI